MIASLPMYDRPEIAAANDTLWAGIRQALGYGPQTLDRATPVWDVWQSPDLLMSQTCGFPYRTRLHGKVQLVGVPDYGLAHTPAGHYHSVFVVRHDDMSELAHYAERTFALNDTLSQSGWIAPQLHARQLGFTFRKTMISGSHRESACAVASGRADIAAIDAVSWRLIQTHDGFANNLRVIGQTRPTPGLPLICARGRDATALFSAFCEAVDHLSPNHRKMLGLRGIVAISPDDYLSMPAPKPS